MIRSLLYLPFVALGIFGKDALGRLSRSSPWWQLLVAAKAWAIFATFWIAEIRPAILRLGASGSIGTVALAMLAAHSKSLGALARASLAIFILHTIFSAGTRIALGAAGLPLTSSASITLSLIAGIASAYRVWLWARQNDQLRFLGLGS